MDIIIYIKVFFSFQKRTFRNLIFKTRGYVCKFIVRCLEMQFQFVESFFLVKVSSERTLGNLTFSIFNCKYTTKKILFFSKFNSVYWCDKVDQWNIK